MSYYSYSYTASESYNSRTGEKKATYAAKETMNGTVRRDVRAERVGEDEYILYKREGDQWIPDTNRGRYYTRAKLEPYLLQGKTRQRVSRKKRIARPKRIQRGG